METIGSLISKLNDIMQYHEFLNRLDKVLSENKQHLAKLREELYKLDKQNRKRGRKEK